MKLETQIQIQLIESYSDDVYILSENRGGKSKELSDQCASTAYLFINYRP